LGNNNIFPEKLVFVVKQGFYIKSLVYLKNTEVSTVHVRSKFLGGGAGTSQNQNWSLEKDQFGFRLKTGF